MYARHRFAREMPGRDDERLLGFVQECGCAPHVDRPFARTLQTRRDPGRVHVVTEGAAQPIGGDVVDPLPRQRRAHIFAGAHANRRAGEHRLDRVREAVRPRTRQNQRSGAQCDEQQGAESLDGLRQDTAAHARAFGPK